MKIKVHTGSVPVSAIGNIGAEMLVAVEEVGVTPQAFKIVPDLVGCNAGVPFARTLTGIDVLDVRDCPFPAERYGMRIKQHQILGGDNDANVDGIMRIVSGLGVKSLAVFMFAPVNYHIEGLEVLSKISEWLCRHDCSLTDVHILSNAVGNVERDFSGFINERHDFSEVLVYGGVVGRVRDGNGNWWYYSDCGNGMSRVDRVVRDFEFTHNLKKLTIPEEIDGKRVVAIGDDAFVQTDVDLVSSGEKVEDWTKILTELSIPRWVSHMNISRVLDSLPALECVNIDPQNHFFESGTPFMIRRII